MRPRIVAVRGSMQQGSTTEALIRHVGSLLEKHGAEVAYLDLRELRLPFFEERAAHGVAQYCAIARRGQAELGN
jgi:NAD(P)H-dependent FMN reductase